jgi:ArsR family transcriptional regulator
MNKTLENEVIQLHAEICGGLADPSRIMILYALSQNPRNVTELSSELNMPQPLVSRHLKILRDRGMVTSERHGTTVTYSLGDPRLVEALDLLRAAMHAIIARRAALVEAIS